MVADHQWSADYRLRTADLYMYLHVCIKHWLGHSWNTASRYGVHTRNRIWKKLDKVQRRATKMIQGYKYLSYKERLIRCGLTTLEKRRSRGYLIEAYKIIRPTGKESIQWERLFELAPSKVTRGHRYKLFKKRKGTLGQKFFSTRVVDLWNELDDSTVSVDNVTAFKRKLGKLAIKYSMVAYSGSNTDYKSSEPLKTLVML